MNDQKQIEAWAKKVQELEGNYEPLYEMANFLHSRQPELPSNIWVSVKNAPHGPRIKIQRNKGVKMQIDDAFSMTVSDEPKAIGNIGSSLSTDDIEYYRNFIIKNKDTLLAYWNGEIDTRDLVQRLDFKV